MKQLYTLIFFLLISFSYGQNSTANGEIDGFKLYPNPVTDNKVYINTTYNASKKISIFDVLGGKVLETILLGKELNLTDINPGVYVLRVYEKDKMVTRKLIIK